MSIYIINIMSLLIYSIIYKYFHQKKNIKLIVISLIIFQFTLLQGLRSFEVGADTQKYISYYEYIVANDTSLYDCIFNPPFNFEIGWMILMFLCKCFHVSSRLFLVIVALIINSLLGYFVYKESDNFIMSFWIFIGVEFFSLSFTMLRQMIAILIIANSLKYIENRKFIKFIIMVLLASSFHKTALIFLPAYFIKIIYDKINFFRHVSTKSIILKVLMIIATYFSVLLILPDLIKKILNIFYGYYHFSRGSIGALFIIMVIILVFLLACEISSKKISFKFFLFQNLIFIASVLQLCTVIIFQIYRGALYYYFFIIILLPFLVRQIKGEKNKIYFSIIIYILTFVQYVIFSLNIYNLVPYNLL